MDNKKGGDGGGKPDHDNLNGGVVVGGKWYPTMYDYLVESTAQRSSSVPATSRTVSVPHSRSTATATATAPSSVEEPEFERYDPERAINDSYEEYVREERDAAAPPKKKPKRVAPPALSAPSSSVSSSPALPRRRPTSAPQTHSVTATTPPLALLPPSVSAPTNARDAEIYSLDPDQHARRVEFRDWLERTTKGSFEEHHPRFLQYCDEVEYHPTRDVFWLPNIGFAMKQANGRNSYCKSDFPNQWRKNISDATVAFQQTPRRKEEVAAAKAKKRDETPHTHVFYIDVSSPNVGPLTVANLCDPNFGMLIYPGQWDAKNNSGYVTSRLGHMTNPRSKVFQLTADSNNHTHEVLAVRCHSLASRHKGEAYILAYGKEWNRLHLGQERFIWTRPETEIGEDGIEEEEAREKARDGIWIFQALDEEDEPHPLEGARFVDLADIPYGIKQSYIKKKVIPSLGQGYNTWKEQ